MSVDMQRHRVGATDVELSPDPATWTAPVSSSPAGDLHLRDAIMKAVQDDLTP